MATYSSLGAVTLCTIILVACSDSPRSDDTLTASARPRSEEAATELASTIADLEVQFGSRYSLDTTQAGLNAPVYPDPDETAERPTLCRDHFKPIDLWWDGGFGIATIHLARHYSFDRTVQGRSRAAG